MTGRNGAARPLVGELVGPAGGGEGGPAPRPLAPPHRGGASRRDPAPAPAPPPRARGRHRPAEWSRKMRDGEPGAGGARPRVGCGGGRGGRAGGGGPPPLTLATTGTTPVRLGDAVLALLAERSHG